MNFTTIKFLISIKNASSGYKDKVVTTYDCSSLPILKLLYNSGLIQGYTIVNKSKVKVLLRRVFNKTLTQNLKIISTPTYKISLDIKKISLIQKNTNCFMFFSTDRGLLTASECKKHKIGGTLLFTC
jgi:ribosomal protein S8